MRCHKCNVHKLYREFPYETLNEDCDHAPLHCLRCTTEHVKKYQRCSMCNHPVALDNPRYQEYVLNLKSLFPDVLIPKAISGTPGSGNETIMISMMGGAVTKIQFDPKMTIRQLKDKIQECFKVKPEQQRLLYKDKELNPESSEDAMLCDCNIKPPSIIYLVLILYNIPDTFEEVIFELSWEYPESDKDFLDATVLLFKDDTFKAVVDWKTKDNKDFPGVRHSGDIMNNTSFIGHHKINVNIKSLPQDINKMFFTLSAWRFPNISKYPNPSLRFYDARFPEEQLCDDSLKKAADSQAIIMCSMCKDKKGQWQVLSLKHLCDGNAGDYIPIKKAIIELINCHRS